VIPREIARELDLVKSGKGWRGACKSCGYGTTLVLSAKGSLWCASCGKDGPAEVLARMQNDEQAQAAERQPGKPEPTAAERTARALVWWNGAPRDALGTPADLYLNGRGLPGLAASPAIRYRTDVSHPAERGTRRPAMLALVQDVTGAPIAVHRTYLTRGGRKADAVPVKAAVGPIFGGAIRLDDAAPELVVGEGIETSASAGRLLGLPAWAAIAAGNLAQRMQLPPEVRSVVIAADADGPGRKAAQDAAARWRAEGRRVRIATPDTPGADFNDILMSGVVHA
jgi:putative DNA primase/helicase